MRFSVIVTVLALAAVAPLEAQSDQAAIVGVVKKVFDGMRTRDTTLMRAQFAPGARMVQVSNKDGKPAVESIDPSGWIGSVGRAKQVLDERIFDPVVQVDGDIAHVWTYYEFWLGEKLSHCGYDSFFMVKLGDAWKVSQVADSRRTDCTPRK